MKFLLADIHLDSPLKTQSTRNSAMGGEPARAGLAAVLARLVDAAIAPGVMLALARGTTSTEMWRMWPAVRLALNSRVSPGRGIRPS